MTKETQFNTQITDAKKVITPLLDLNLIDDFLFDVTTVDPEACKIIIELSLGIHIREIRWKEGQKVTHNLPGKRGIRMDFYVETTDGKVFEVEMQKRNRGNIPKRTRFYQGLLDAPMLKSGEESFDHLNPTYIIVICGFDLYKCGKYRYTFSNSCKEVTGLELGDECTKIILNTKGKNDDEVERSLVDFLHYIEHSIDANVPEDCDERLKYLHQITKQIKASEQIGVSYMTMEERDRQIREDGYLAGIADGEENGRKEGIQLAGDVIKLISQQPDITDTEVAERFQCNVEVVQRIRKAFER